MQRLRLALPVTGIVATLGDQAAVQAMVTALLKAFAG